jgi:hypothetical protein
VACRPRKFTRPDFILEEIVLKAPVAVNDNQRNLPCGLYGIVRRLADSDPHNLNHPSQRENWLAVARAIGEALADEDYERERGNYEEVSNQQGGDLRKVLH